MIPHCLNARKAYVTLIAPDLLPTFKALATLQREFSQGKHKILGIYFCE